MLLITFVAYQLLQIVVLPFFLIFILLRKFRKKPVFGKFSERIGLVPKTGNRNVIWIHAVSVGEVLSIQNFIKDIKTKNPETICYLTVGTIGGKKIAQEKLEADFVSFIPYDFLFSTMIAYKRINPSKIIIVEAETWPNLITLAHFKKIPLYLINARISPRSKNRYFKMKKIIAPLFNTFEKIYTQSEDDRKNFINLGVKENKLENLGNIKAYNVIRKVTEKEAQEIDSEEKSKQTLLVGSVHPGEIDIYLKMFCDLKKTFKDLKIIIAPRHFHWKEELIKKVKNTGFDFTVWDNENKPKDTWEILLVCKLGELFKLYKEASIFYLGGTFVPIGGHNLLEPAVWSNPILIGPHYQNNIDIVNKLSKNNGVVIAKNEQALTEKTKSLIVNNQARVNLGKNARKWLLTEGSIVESKLNKFSQVFSQPK